MAHMPSRFWIGLAAAIVLVGMQIRTASAAETTIAVAANFTSAAKRLGAVFEASTGHRVVFSFGSTGQLFAQIAHGAPFDAFLAADVARPKRAVTDGLAVPGTRFTYAVGILVLWSADPDLIDGTPSVLSDPNLRHVAIASPAIAPYGAAAIETMTRLGVLNGLRPRLVDGKSINQTYQFVATGNAPVGFVAASQVQDSNEGSRWRVPEDMHQPLRQDAVLLARGRNNEAARAFLEFLKSPEAVTMIRELGYR
ncbi:MAG: molybdate ABC transporter substrate-binding protein [Methyloceanibacter sp.]|nr:molybdate ABC transporter substrate-binding protein [Methyloceanibacter sp.]